jgi:hypothetical protein
MASYYANVKQFVSGRNIGEAQPALSANRTSSSTRSRLASLVIAFGKDFAHIVSGMP